MAKITKTDTSTRTKKPTKKDIGKEIKLAASVKGIWNEKKWKEKPSIEIVDFLRERSQRTYVR